MLATSISYTVDKDKRTMIFGIGTNTCSQMTSEVTNNKIGERMYIAYINGYLSAYNDLHLGKTNYFRGTTNISRYKYVLLHCKSNPQDQIINGLIKLITKYK